MKSNIWTELSTNQKVSVKTKFDLTTEIAINDRLRLGESLSGREFASFIDELNNIMMSEGMEINHSYLKIASLWFMDDTSLLASTREDLEELLHIIDKFVSK